MTIASETTPLFGTLSQTLWRQHGLLELLLYRLEVQRLVLADGGAGWTQIAADDVEATMDVLREEELIRAAQVARVAEAFGLDTDASLRELVEAAPEPWAEILRDHQRSFLDLVDRIESTSKANRDLVRRSLQSTREMLSMPAGDGEAGTYDRSGARPTGRTAPVLVDRDA